jgi:hypothetical protein
LKAFVRGTRSKPGCSPGITKVKRKRAVSNVIFTAAVVILVAAAGVGFGLYAMAVGGGGGGSSSTTTSTSMQPHTVTEMVTTTTTNEMTVMMTNETSSPSNQSAGALMFSPKSGAMISNAWLVSSEIGMHEYAVVVHAEGLESNGTYIVEGALASGSMQVVPVSSESMSMNTTSASEFQASAKGTGLFWIVVDSNPASTFENLELVYLPGMSMSNATVVATAMFGMGGETAATNTTATMMSSAEMDSSTSAIMSDTQ